MVNVLGVPLFEFNINKATSEIIATCNSDAAKLNRCVSATGAHGIVFAQKNPAFKKLLSEFYWNLPDGMPGVWVGLLKGSKEMKRCYGPDFFKETIIATADKKIKHFFCGGKEGVAEELQEACEVKFRNSNIVGTFSPPFREMTEVELTELGNTINKSGADVVWIGISTPKQEKFAYKLKKFVSAHFIITVGAAFDFHTGRIKSAPRWMQQTGMEWFYRLMSEPKRLFPRYFEIVPLFIYYNLREFSTFVAGNFKKK